MDTDVQQHCSPDIILGRRELEGHIIESICLLPGSSGRYITTGMAATSSNWRGEGMSN